MQGWISLHRELLDNPIVCKDTHYFTIWIYLLLQATHTDQDKIFKGNKVKLKRGQLITGRKSLANRFNINESKVQRILKMFESEQMIEQQTSNKNRLITILKYELYQSVEQQIKQPVNNKRTTNEQPVNTNNNVNKEINVNKVIKTYYENVKLNELFIEFLKLRKKLKAVNTERAINGLINKLEKHDDNIKILMINESIINSWKSVFELKKDKIMNYKNNKNLLPKDVESDWFEDWQRENGLLE